MTNAQIATIKRLKREVQKAAAVLERRHQELRAASQDCDHFDARKHSALKQVSTHEPLTCGGYKECAVCAGEQEETFVEVCEICDKTLSGSLTALQAANRKARRHG